MYLVIRVGVTALASAVVVVIAACGGGSGGAQAAPATGTASVTTRLPQNPDLSVITVGRDFGTGKNRLPLAVLRQGGTSINDRAQDIEVTYGLVNTGTPKRLAQLTWRAWPVLNGVYVGSAEFDRAGIWEFKVTLAEGGKKLTGSAFVEVGEKPAAPGVGDAAPTVATKTGSTTEDLRQITSYPNPDPDLYRTSLGDAVKSGKPVVVTFATPAFCATQTCGPQVEVLGRLQDRYGDRAHFIHVEIWDNPREMLDKGDPSVGKLSPAVEAWKLPSEPWTFLVDSSGHIFARFEAFTTEAELDEAINTLLGP